MDQLVFVLDAQGITATQVAEMRGDYGMATLLGYSRFTDRNTQQKDYATYMR